MGYTHYWRKTDKSHKLQEEWTTALTHAVNVIQACHHIVVDQRDWDTFSINGIDDDAHEDFRLPREVDQLDGFDFCKTAAKPYDVVVTAILAIMHHFAPGALEISSDGTPEEWEEGLKLASEVCGVRLACPFEDGEED